MSALASPPVDTLPIIVNVGNCRYTFAAGTDQASIDKLMGKARKVHGRYVKAVAPLPKLGRINAPTPAMLKAMRANELTLVSGDAQAGLVKHCERLVARAERKEWDREEVAKLRAKATPKAMAGIDLERLHAVAGQPTSRITTWDGALNVLLAQSELARRGNPSPVVDADPADTIPSSPVDDTIEDMREPVDLSELEAIANTYRKLRDAEIAAREELHAAMHAMYDAGVPQSDIARATGWHRQHVHRLLKR